MRLRSNDLGPGRTKTTPPGHFPGPTLSSLYEACPEYCAYWNSGSEEQPASAPDRGRSHGVLISPRGFVGVLFASGHGCCGIDIPNNNRTILTTNRDERTVVGSKADSGNRSDVVERARARTGLLGAGVADKSHGSGCVTVGQERRRPRTVCGRHVNRAVTVEIA